MENRKGVLPSLATDDSEDHFAGYVIDDSDLEYSDCSSSDDELISSRSYKTKPVSLVPPTYTKPHPQISEDEEDESEDDFEREMNEKAEQLLVTNLHSPTFKKDTFQSRGLEEKGAGTSDPLLDEVGGASSNKEGGVNSDKDLFYDDIYFDSSSEEDTQSILQSHSEKTKKKRDVRKVRKLTNDELLYDPELDKEDEKWIEKQRRAYHNIKGVHDREGKGKGSVEETTVAAPMSDAVLNCPACLSTLCLDCQRHDVYHNQYRAMFVLNCTIIKNEILHYKPKHETRKRQREDTSTTSSTHSLKDTPSTHPLADDKDTPITTSTHPLTDDKNTPANSEHYYPVKCTICNTEVAVFDSEQVFHFFNVLASPS